MKKKLLTLTVMLMIFLNLFLVSAITGRIGNAQTTLSPNNYPELGNVQETVIIERSILVRNTNDVIVNITLEPENSISGLLEIKDSNFLLNPGENKSAEFLVKVEKPGFYQGNINVFFTPENGTGVAIPSKLTVIADGPKNSFLSGKSLGAWEIALSITTLLLVMVLVIIVYKFARKKK